MHDDVSRELVVARPDDEYVVRMAVTGFLAGYSGLTRDAYALDLRTFWRWCTDHGLGLFSVRRTHIELFARWLEQEGKAKATVARRRRRSACSTGSANKNNSSSTPRRSMSAAPS